MNSDIATLEDLEQEAAEEVSIAIDQLHEARDEIRAEEPVNEHFNPPDMMSDMMSEMLSVGSSTRSNKHVVFAEPDTPDEESDKPEDLWEQCEALIGSEQYMVKRKGKAIKRKMNTGAWYNPFKRPFNNPAIGVDILSSVLLMTVAATL